MAAQLTEEELQDIYTWVDQIPLSRPKRNITRDFADGVLVSEITKHFFPRMVELHNYSSSNSTGQKLYNWNTLNQKVFKKMGFVIEKEDIDAVVNAERGAVERILQFVRFKFADFQTRVASDPDLMGPMPVAVAPPSTAPSAPASHAAEGKKPKPLAGARASPGIAAAGAASLSPPGGGAARKATNAGAGAGKGAPAPVAGMVQPLSARMPLGALQSPSYDSIDHGIMQQQDRAVSELRETVDVLQLKVSKLEQLLKLKDSKIETLQGRLAKLTPAEPLAPKK